MAEYGRGRGKYGRVVEKSERMSVCGKGRGKGWQSVGEEEGKDGRVWTQKRERMPKYGRGRRKMAMDGEEEKDIIVRRGKRERMAEYKRGRGKGWQSIDREEGRMAE
jgi:hypothetical protein